MALTAVDERYVGPGGCGAAPAAAIGPQADRLARDAGVGRSLGLGGGDVCGGQLQRSGVDDLGEVVLRHRVDDPRVQIACDDLRQLHERLEESDVRDDARHGGTAQRGAHERDGLCTIPGCDDELRDHRVVVAHDPLARFQPGVHADALTRGEGDVQRGAARGQEAASRVLRIDAGLDRMAGERDVVLCESQLLTRPDPQLPLDEVDSRDLLRDGVLDLEAGVHLHEEELVRTVRGHDELDCARTPVVDGLRGVDGGLPDAGAGGLVEQRTGRLLDDLLVAALQRALALPQVDDVPVLIGEHLHLDVARGEHQPLEEEGVVAEAACGLASGRGERLGQVCRVVDLAHPLAAAACGRLHEDGEAHLTRAGDELFVREPGFRDSGNQRHATRGDGLLRGDLVTHDVDRCGGGAEEDDALLLETAGECRILGEEAVSRVDRLGACRPDSRDDPLDVEVGLGGRGRPQPIGEVRGLRVGGLGVGIGVDGDGLDAQIAAGADDAQGDLAAVGDEDPGEHVPHILKTP